jgi:hypothetical protein
MFKKSEKNLATSTGWATGVNPNNFRKFRLGHVILWLAECEAQVGSPSVQPVWLMKFVTGQKIQMLFG